MKKKKSSAIKKIIQVVLLTILMFYHIYPTGFPLFGFSFIFTSGLIGLGLYAYNRFPYSEVASLGALYLMMVCWSLFCTFVNATNDSFIVDYTKSEVGWLFSAYLMIYLFFKIHPDGKPIYVAYYLIAVVALQCIISLMMSQNEAVNDFFNDLQQLNPLEAFKRRQTEGNRLLGYGTAFFGAGVCCGTALILLGYVLMSQKWNFWRLLLIAFLYAGIFYVGLLSARTTMVGGAASAILIVILVFQRRAPLSQLSKFAGLGFMMFSIGYTLCFLYYPEFVDWAFEAFDSYEEYGSFQTDSSNGLAVMFIMPSTMSDWVVGWGIGRFLMSDVGYTRLWMWFGLPGAVMFFCYQFMIIKRAFTNNMVLNLTLITLFVYNIVLNYKGLSDLNHFCLMFAFYFLHYKYNIYTPYLYRIGKFNQTKLRYAVQAQTAGRRF